MDLNTFEAKYGYAAPKQTFKSGARAGIIVASVLSILVSAAQLLLLIAAARTYFGDSGDSFIRPMSFLPLIAAALMIIAGAAARPTSKVALAIPVSLFAVGEVYIFVANIVTYIGLGFGPLDLLSGLWNAVPLYPLVVVLLMWLTCGGVIKNGTVGGALIAITSVLGCFISVIVNASQFGAMYYNDMVLVLTLANIISSVAAMLFYVANAAALFMIGAKPKMPQFGYVPSAYQTQGTTPQPPVQQVTQPLPTVEEQPTDNNTEGN